MKKIMSVLLGLSLLTGTVAFAKEKTTNNSDKSKAKKGKKKSPKKMTTSST
jgi:hypothetical protein